MIFDTHFSIHSAASIAGAPAMFAKATLEGALKRMDELGIAKVIIWSTARNHEESVGNNDWVASLVRAYPDRIIAFCNVHPPAGEAALSEFERRISSPEFIGLKLHPVRGKYQANDPSVLALLRRARAHDVPVVTHVTSSAHEEATSIEQFIDRQKELDDQDPFAKSSYLLDWLDVYDSPKVISAHFGGLFDERLRSSRITFQTAGASTPAIEYGYQTLGSARLIYGSDFPFYEPSDEIAKVSRAAIPEEAKQAILGGNARVLLGLG